MPFFQFKIELEDKIIEFVKQEFLNNNLLQSMLHRLNYCLVELCSLNS